MTQPTSDQLNAMMAVDDFQGLGQAAQQLLAMPQSLCKLRGNCCRILTYKGSLSHEDLITLAQSDDPDAANAREFLSIAVPYDSREEVERIAPVFVERVLQASCKSNPEDVTFFRCRYLGEDSLCQIHEDRPTGCRAYPFPHEKTIFHPGCGFEPVAKANWQAIQSIMTFFERRQQELATAAQVSEPPQSEI